MAINICSQTQRIAEHWVWSAYLLDIEKISSKMSLFSRDFPKFWAWMTPDFYICPIEYNILILSAPHSARINTWSQVP